MCSLQRWSAAASGVALTLALTGCAGTSGASTAAPSTDGLHGSDVTSAVTRPSLALTDLDGHPVDLAHVPAGHVTLVFFGYTRCTDVCPATAADLAAARRRLSGQDRARTSVVFVDVDPEHDDVPTVRRWLARFDDRFTGVTAPRSTTNQLLTALHAPTTQDASGEPQHSGLVYAFTPRTSLVYTGGTTPTDYVADVHALLHG